MTVVIDASITIAWLLGESTLEERDEFASRIRSEGAVTPAHWRLEVANALLQSVRRNRVTTDDVDQYLNSLREFPIITDGETDERAWSDTLTIARLHLLTVYDAAYLELAIRRQISLATLDRQLIEAARGVGVEVIHSP